jgi:hypothetical protein
VPVEDAAEHAVLHAEPLKENKSIGISKQ